ncbi:MAG: 2OG-Fe(II) oxygenase [Acetobacteraceae bacterium]
MDLVETTVVDTPHRGMPPCAGSGIRRALRAAERREAPFRHWLLTDVLPRVLCQPLLELPLTPPDVDDTQGKRETHNASRIFINEDAQRRYPVCAVLADAFQDEATVGLLRDVTGADLSGGFLRIEYCLDTEGFWLEPHTDIGAKLFTLLIYLSDHPDAADWGTDLMDPAGNVLGRAPGDFDKGLMFIPGSDTWHGFTRRPIRGVRRSLIVNYVKPEWRSRHELAFPHQAVVAA